MTQNIDDGRLPLEGVKVVALEQAVSLPLATRHLADLGARVIKLERPGDGDFARTYDEAVLGLSAHFVWTNRSKESVVVDLQTDQGRGLALALIDTADVFVQNLGPGAVERLGLGAEALRARNPRLVVVDVTGYGRTGPRRDRKAYDLLVQAESGMVSVTGTPETATKTGVASADIATGVYVTISVLAALFRREQTGQGAAVDVSMFDSAVEWMGYPVYTQLYTGRQVPRMGLSHASICPYAAYPTLDGTIVIGVQNERGWRALVEDVFAAPEYGQHPRFRSNPLRVQHRAEVDKLISGFTETWTTADLDRRLAEAGVPAAQVNLVADLIDHPQLRERDRWRRVGTEHGEISALLPPMTFRDVELRMGPVPALGEHTAAVVRELGLGSDGSR
jgi:crotonobetainyl-CoA:carnitine CoA-transferase CaiB-like acyl-CoA transferase